LATKSLTKIFS